MAFLFLDTETGGIDTLCDLLSAYFLVLDENFNKVEDLNLLLKPNYGVYRVGGKALEVNKINLAEHDKHAVTYERGRVLLGTFLTDMAVLRKLGKLTPVGHNIAFDLNFINTHLLKKEEWQANVTYRPLDTQVIAQYLLLTGRLKGISGSLESLATYFGLERQNHMAKADTLLTVEVFKKLCQLR